MKYNEKEVINQIVKRSLKQLDPKLLKKFKSINIQDHVEKIKQNSKLMRELEYLELDIQELIITKKDLKKIIDKEIDQNEIIDLCQVLKCINFKFEYVCIDGYCIDFLNYFNEVSYSLANEHVRLYISDKILLNGENFQC